MRHTILAIATLAFVPAAHAADLDVAPPPQAAEPAPPAVAEPYGVPVPAEPAPPAVAAVPYAVPVPTLPYVWHQPCPWWGCRPYAYGYGYRPYAYGYGYPGWHHGGCQFQARSSCS
jgi:hypothetical protein